MVNLTEYVIVLNQVYSISLIEGFTEQTNLHGVCDVELKTIEIDAGLNETRTKRVLLHELMHAFMFESGMSEYTEAQAEEMVCQSLSGFLNSILEWKFALTEGST